MFTDARRLAVRPQHRSAALPPQIVLGLALLAVAWPIAWAGPAPISRHTFFPLWLGYILTVDGVVLYRTGTSLLTRARWRFPLLFVVSAPLWWLFEGFNQRLNNWRYLMPEEYGPLAYTVLAALAFSTVVPAMFETADLYRSLPAFRRSRCWLRIAPSNRGLVWITTGGLAMIGLTLAFPRAAFPLVWLGLFFAIDPFNRLAGANSIAAQVEERRWDTVWVLFLAALTCGFFWEMWNVQSLPKWVYEVPYVEGPKLFEMPWLGYGGYLPFALEVYAAYHALHGLLFRRRDAYLRFDRAAGQEER